MDLYEHKWRSTEQDLLSAMQTVSDTRRYIGGIIATVGKNL